MSSYPLVLKSLNPREAITDTLFRVLIGFDENDILMFNSGFADDDVSFVMNGNVTQGLDTIRTQLLSHVGPLVREIPGSGFGIIAALWEVKDTTHMVSGVRISLDDDADTAKLTATSMNQHAPPGRGSEPDVPKFLAGGRYWVDFVKVNGEWKIKKWEMKIVWTQGDASIMQSV